MKKYYGIIVLVMGLFFIVGCNSDYDQHINNSLIDQVLMNNPAIVEDYLEENKLNIIEEHQYDDSLLICSENDISYHFAAFKVTKDKNNLKLVSHDSIIKENRSKVEVVYLNDKVKNFAIVCVLDKELKQNMNSILIDIANLSKNGLSSIEISPIDNGIGVFEEDIDMNKNFIIKQVTIKKENNVLYKIEID